MVAKGDQKRSFLIKTSKYRDILHIRVGGGNQLLLGRNDKRRCSMQARTSPACRRSPAASSIFKDNRLDLRAPAPASGSGLRLCPSGDYVCIHGQDILITSSVVRLLTWTRYHSTFCSSADRIRNTSLSPSPSPSRCAIRPPQRKHLTVATISRRTTQSNTSTPTRAVPRQRSPAVSSGGQYDAHDR